MRIILPVFGGGDGGEPRSLRSKMGGMSRMRKLLWLRTNPCVDVHMDSEPGVWLRSFQLIDTDAQYEDPVQEWGEEEEDGALFGITLRREPVLPNSDTGELATAFAQYHTVKVRRLKAATLERLVTHLLDPDNQEPDFTRVFLSTYRAFTSTSTLIELLFQRDDSIASLDNTVCPRSTLPPVIRLWLMDYSEDFHEPPQYPALRLICAHLHHRICFRRLAKTAETLLKRLQEQDCSRSASQDSGKSLQQDPRDEEDGSDTSAKEDKHSFMDLPVREIAEQLTRLDADLFARVVPFHCLGCVWSQRDKKDNRNLAPTVRATIFQFNAVTNRVITSLLCPSSPSPPTSSPISSPVSSSNFLYPSTAPSSPRCSHASPAHRARIIERWIAVAQECRELKNFSSLRAILSALQSNAVYRLKKTWAAVSRESTAAFDHLCDTFPDENCVLTTREILVEDDSPSDSSTTTGSKPRLCSTSKQMNLSSGVVPYLGTYLTVLTMLDTALTDTVEGGLINFEKRRREFEILSQIRQLQASCSHYNLQVNPHITAWLQAHTLLTDQESYELSRDLEPPVDPCPSSPNSWSSRLLTKKLASLRTASDSSIRKTHADQISVSSSGSSSSEMEDLSAPQPSPLRLKLKSLSGSLLDVAEDFSSSSPSLSTSSCSSSQPDLSSSSLALSPESSSSSCSPQASLPVYNKQVADSCIIRVSVESVSNGNVYKSILLTSQDHTPQVIQRAIEKHNMEDVSCHDFSLCQMLSNGKELQIPDKANVFYAMCTNANYDFVLRQHWRSHGRHLGSSLSPGAPAKGRYAK
nr:PREDICTED: ral guanine nucleotide dissociation stimulator-like 1 isoform X1 [Paralichthys olivaceus]XP_019939985.1 PREDICTED: ral guanine nucleotide dissociation stimulator-like 1 isoform X1 [Paralichthys olivaceus]XP_019939987.1 PREDICTED: ral guanine nucleotide dissociation stimulator-like 1 isoform X1 [Paralichthys olivaceus]